VGPRLVGLSAFLDENRCSPGSCRHGKSVGSRASLARPDPQVEISEERASPVYFSCFRKPLRPKMPAAANPLPSSRSVPGSGTGLGVLGCSMLTIRVLVAT